MTTDKILQSKNAGNQCQGVSSTELRNERAYSRLINEFTEIVETKVPELNDFDMFEKRYVNLYIPILDLTIQELEKLQLVINILY